MKFVIRRHRYEDGQDGYYFEWYVGNTVLQSPAFVDQVHCRQWIEDIQTQVQSSDGLKKASIEKRDGEWWLIFSTSQQLKYLADDYLEDDKGSEEALNNLTKAIFKGSSTEIIDTTQRSRAIRLEEDVYELSELPPERKMQEEAKPDQVINIENQDDEVTKIEDSSGAPVSSHSASSSGNIDDYNPAIESTATGFDFERFQIEEDGQQRYYFHLNDEQGKPLLISERYHSQAGREKGIRSVISNGRNKQNFRTREQDGQAFVSLLAANGQEIARSYPGVDPEDVITAVCTWCDQHQEITHPCQPFFKPLEPLLRADLPIFWGREREIEDLYNMSFDTALLLLFGATGVGKSSLIRCGLANKFSPTRWHEIVIGRQDDINYSLDQALHREEKALDISPTSARSIEQLKGSTPKPTRSMSSSSARRMAQLKSIQKIVFKPIYLIFDDLETLFQVTDNEEERQHFFTFLYDLVESGLAVKAILIIEEAWLAYLWNYEPIVPTLFANQYRLESASSEEVATGLASSLDDLAELGWSIPEVEEVVDLILNKFSEDKPHVEPACLQIYLHQLQQQGCEQENGSAPVLNAELIDQAGSPQELIDAFLAEQQEKLKAISQDQENEAASQELQKKLEKAQQGCQGVTPEIVPPVVTPRGITPPVVVPPYPVDPKVIPPVKKAPWWIWLGWLLALLLLLLWIFWPKDENGHTPPCVNADGKMPETCEQLIDYLRISNCTDTCGVKYLARLQEMDCPGVSTLLEDYFTVLEAQDCNYYYRYLRRYGNEGICVDNILSLINLNGCPPDTIYIRDTIIKGFEKIKLCIAKSCEDYKDYLAQHKNGPCADTYRRLLNAECLCQANTCEQWQQYLKDNEADAPCYQKYWQLAENCPPPPPPPSSCDKLSCAGYMDYLDKHDKDSDCWEEYIDRLLKECGIIYTYPLYIWPRERLFTWEEALGGCPSGWRLPCLGEVYYFNNNYNVLNYRKYVTSFWTATESDDPLAWSVQSGGAKLVPEKDTPKSTRLPCLCVKERPTYPNSDIRKTSYPCYVKSIRN